MQSIVLLASFGLSASGCTARPPPLATGSARDDGHIPLGPRAQVRATLTSTEPGTAFSITGTGADADLLLPRTNIARVLLPRSAVNIVARAPCFRDLAHFIQAGGLTDGAEIAFHFSNLDRREGCEEETPAASASALTDAEPPTAFARRAWVITNARYHRRDWPTLAFVDNDRARMTALLRRAGYRVSVSADRPRAQLMADADEFRQALALPGLEVAIVYISGHGVSLNGANYLVPADAPPSASMRPEHLFGMDRVVRDLQPFAAAGGCAVALVDACRSEYGVGAEPLVAEAPRNVLVNHSAAPGGTSYDSERNVSAWTEQFISIAEDFPEVGVDQVLGYANRYTKWRSETSLKVQAPVLYGRPSAPPPPFGRRRAAQRRSVLPQLRIFDS